MATSQDTKVKIIDIQVKYQEAVDAMAKYSASIEEARVHLKTLKKDLKDGKITQEEYNRQSEASRVFIKQQGDALNTLSRQVQNQIRTQKENEGSLKQLRAELSNATAAYDAMSRAERESAKGQDLKNHIVQITTELKNAEEGTMRFYRNVGNYEGAASGLENIKTKIKDFGSSIAVAVTGGSIAAFASSVKEVGMAFDDQMAKVKAVTNATDEQYTMLRNKAMELGESTRYTATEAAEALELLSRNGLTAEQATGTLSGVLQLAQANAIGMAEAADTMTGVMNSFHLSVEETTRINDVLSQTSARSATNVTLLAESLRNSAPTAHSLGISFEETTAAIGALADNNIKGADAGTKMQQVLLGLSSPTAKQAKAFKELGLNISADTIKTDGLTGTLQKLADSGVMNMSNRMQLLGDIFGRRATPAILALLQSFDKLKLHLEENMNAAGTNARMFDQSYSDLSVCITSLSSAFESLKIRIYDAFKDSAIAPVRTLTSLVTGLSHNLSMVGEVVMAVIAGISFTKLISNARSSFLQIKNSAVTNAQTATQQVQVCQNNEIAIRRETALLTKQLANSSAIERERIETQLVAKKRQLANAEKATQKAKTAEITLWERAAALETGNGWQQAFAVAKMGVQGFVATAKTAFRGFIVTAMLSLAFELIMKLYQKLSEGEGVWANLKRYATAAWTAIANAAFTVINACIDLYNNIAIVRLGIQVVAMQFKNLWEGVKLIFNLLIDGVKSVGRAMSGLGEIIKGVVTFSWDDIKQGFADITSNFGKTIKEGWEDLKNFGRNVANNVLDAYNKTVTQGDIAHIQPIVDEPTSKPTKKNTKNKTNQQATTQTTQEAEQDKPTKPGGGGSEQDEKAKKKAAKEAEKRRKAEAKAAQEEQKLVAEAEKAMLDLLGESVEKRRALLENQYNGEINKLKVKLATDKTLTEKSKEAIQQLIVAKQKKMQEEIDKLDDDNIKRSIENQQKLIESRLSIAKKGSTDELNLKLEQNRKKTDLDILALKQEEDAAQKGAATALMYRQQTLAELEQSGTATEEELEKARAAVAYAQSQITQISEDYTERRVNRLEQSYQQEDELRRAHDEAVLEQQQLALQNEMTMVEMFQEEEMARRTDDWNTKQTFEEYLQENDLDIVTAFEMRKLQIQQEMAEQRLAFIQQQGQLETETEEQFNSRVIAAKQAVASAKQAVNKASLKNEQAYAKSMQSVGDSIISLMDAIGESDKNFAKLSKIITLFKITVDTGKAISAGVANAMELPYPANLAAVATTVATVLANIATAVSTVKSANFAEGGKVTGPGTGTSDSIPANLSNGEYVMTAKATKIFEPLLNVMNAIGAGVPISTNGVYERAESAASMTDSFAEAAREIKPVVSVVEITEAQDRIKMIENLDNF